MKLFKALLILSLLSLCVNLGCATRVKRQEAAGKIQLFNVDVQSEKAEVWKQFFGAMQALFAEFPPPSETTAPPDIIEQPTNERWRWMDNKHHQFKFS